MGDKQCLLEFPNLSVTVSMGNIVRLTPKRSFPPKPNLVKLKPRGLSALPNYFEYLDVCDPVATRVLRRLAFQRFGTELVVE